MYICSM